MQERRFHAALALLILGATLLCFVTASRLAVQALGTSPDSLRLAMVLGFVLGLGPPCLGVLLLWRPARESLALKPPAAALLAACLLVVAGLWVPLWAVDSLRARLVGDPGKEAVIRILLTPGRGGWVAVLLVLAGIPALFEELAFRGLLQPVLSAAWGTAPGILATSALFAAFHMSPAQTAVQFALGAALGWMRHRTGSLWPCILGHALHNAVAVAAMAARPDLFGDHPALPPLSWVAAGLLLAALSARALKRRTAGG